MEKRTNSKDLFRQMVKSIVINESAGEIESIVYLVLHSLFGVRREQIMAGKELTFDDRELDDIINRINNYEPVQYILQEAEFYGRLFYVNNDVLIPRPETEILVSEVRQYAGGRSVRILDIGTGSGCIAVTLACELPNATVMATDISNGAIDVAYKNSLTFNTYIEFFRNDILNEDLPVSDIDIVVSNPPYIGKEEAVSMSRNVVDHEPHLALFVPDDNPLLFYKALAGKVKRPCAVFVEINERYGNEVRLLFVEQGFKAEIIKDMEGKDRVVKAYFE